MSKITVTVIICTKSLKLPSGLIKLCNSVILLIKIWYFKRNCIYFKYINNKTKGDGKKKVWTILIVAVKFYWELTETKIKTNRKPEEPSMKITLVKIFFIR